MEVLNSSSDLSHLEVKKCCQQYFLENVEDNIKIVSFECSKIGDEPSGFLGNHQFLTIRVTRKMPTGITEHTLKFFLKTEPQGVASHKEYTEDFGVFQKEIYFFSEVIPRLSSINISLENFSPKCFLAKNNILVFENLSDQGFRMGAQRDGLLDYEHLLSSLKTLANMHSASLVLQQRLGKKINEIFNDSLEENAYPSDPKAIRHIYVGKSIEALCELLKSITKYRNSSDWNKISREFPRIMKKMFEFAKTSSKFQNVICHGDIWANNIMYKYENNSECNTPKVIDCRLVDFQLARFAPPALDVITMLTIPTSREFRKQNLQKLLNQYYKFLQRNLFQHEMNLDEILSRQEFEESVEYYKLAGLIESCLFSHLTILPKDVCSNMLNNSNDFDEFVNHKRSELCLRAFNSDQIYRERLTDMISEVVDEYILK